MSTPNPNVVHLYMHLWTCHVCVQKEEEANDPSLD